MAVNHRFFALVCATVSIVSCGKKEKSGDVDQLENQPQASTGCPVDRVARCNEVQQKIQDLTNQQLAAKDQQDGPTLARVSLELNHERELLAILTDPASDQAALDALESKYVQLRSLLEAQLVEKPLEPEDPKNPGGDRPDDEIVPTIVYHEREVKAVGDVMKQFGDLYVSESGTNQDGTSKYEKVEAAERPWAGYWYPFRSNELFEGDDSPLRKLDRARSAEGAASNAAETEREHRDIFYADSWEGLCASWAMAAIVTTEPRNPVTYQGVTFTVADQKALLIKAHELYASSFLGVRYNGDAETDGTIQDLRPEAFHRIFLTLLGQQRKAFVIDDEPGIEVWSKPVYRVRWTIKKDPEKQHAYLVKALPWMIRHRSSVTDETTSSSDIAAPVYEYRLYVDPKIVQDGKFKVIAGEWLGDSLNAHPDAVVLPAPGATMKSSNPEVDKAMATIQSIVAAGH